MRSQPLARPAVARSGGHRVEYSVIAGAAAEVAHHPIFDFVFGRMGVEVQQGLGGDDLPRRTDAALEATVVYERLLHRVKLPLVCDALDGRDFGALDGGGQSDAGGVQLSVNQHGAGTADAHAATLLGAGQPQVIAQEVQQEASRWDVGLAFHAVDIQLSHLRHNSVM